MQQMEELVHRFYEDQHQPPTIIQRLEYVFSTAYPLRWQMQREWAETLGRLGLVKSALAVFESIEMWEHVIDCHRLMGNWSRAYALITEQVRRRGASPRLLCVLGDVLVMQPQLERPSDDRRTPEELYEEAWIRSGERYARAQRSLGRLAMRRGDWQRAYDHFRLALAVNPLYQEIWFASGFCAQKAEQWDRATESYTSAVQYEPEHAEAWSNLGHALLRQSGDETTSQMLRMRRIVKCFAEAARLRPESWQIWQNLLVAATVAQEWATAIRAQTKLIALRGREGYDRSSMATVIKAISGALEITRTQAESSLVGGATNERLLVSLEPLLRHLASIGISDALIWSTLGRCARERGEFREALEYNRKTIRALEASERRPPFGLKPTTNGCDAESERAQARSALTRAYCELGETLVAARKQQDRRDQGALPCAMQNTAQLDRSVTAQMALFLKGISEAGDNDPTVERLREIAELLGI
ncbi:Tetratricopeptide repeat domain 27 [Cyanidiococcus yangmingshanensis]|uniref:Tetratricopeptide repeat domain 27 n=1 Tax=Cyanidiococcus yangmingshanensis TaxID=2690220 RepID=A0A7J7IF04_9RHOD|nr:Tetratricopeptide repeat domain 27 [Cyanidiococcus yangmingshanensis]